MRMRRDSWIPWSSFALFTVWVINANRGVLTYLIHNPDVFSWNSLLLIARNTGRPLVILVFLSFIFVGCGQMIQKKLRIRLDGPIDVISSFALGYGVFTWILWLIGLVGGYRLPVFLTAISIGFFIAFQNLKKIDFSKVYPYDLASLPPPWRIFIPTVLAIALWHGLMTALAPPIEWDTLAYHLALPKLYLMDKSIHSIPWMIHQHWPHLTEIFYGVALALKSDNLAGLFHWFVSSLVLLWIWHTAHVYLNNRAAWVAIAFMGCQTLFLRFSGTAHCDAVLTLFYLLACTAVWRGISEGDWRLSLIGGVFSGFAVLTKLIGIVLVPLFAAWILLGQEAKNKRRHHILVFTISSLAIAGPWFIWTWAVTGNPIWPFLSRLFPDRWGASVIAPKYVANEYWTVSNAKQFLFLYDPQFYVIPFCLLIAVRWLMKVRFPPFLRFMLFPLIPYVLIFGKTTEAGRFIWPMLPGIILVIAWSAVCLWRKGWIVAAAASGLLLVGFVPLIIAQENNALFAVLELRSHHEPDKLPRIAFLDKQTDHFHFYQEVARLVQPKDKILLFQEIRGFYLDRPYMWGDPLNQGVILYTLLPDSQVLRQQMGDLGITHVLTNAHNIQYYRNENYYDQHALGLMTTVLSKQAKLILTENGLSLYALTPAPGDHTMNQNSPR